jgi:hypothetical protein
VVKVEVWDVVDNGLLTNQVGAKGGELDLNNPAMKEQIKKGQNLHGTYRMAALDATMVDVYKDSSAVIFVVNPCDSMSFDYVQ